MSLLLADRAATASPLPLVTARDARTLGLRLDAPTYRRVRRGVWVDARAYAALPPWQRYAVRVHAFVQVCPDAVLCLEAAAVLHGLPLFNEPRHIHVYDSDRAKSRTFGDVVVHTSRTARQVVKIDGVAVTSMIDTVADLARVLPAVHALCVVDSAISPVQGGALTIDELCAFSRAQDIPRGRRRLEQALAEADARAESPGETVGRYVVTWAGFERPLLQVEFSYEGFRDRPDLHFPRANVLAETDGWGKYDLKNPEAAERHFKDEKRRENRLRRHGHGFTRWEMRDAWRVDPVCRALRAEGVQQERPANAAKLAAVRARSPR